ncbi:hypothetical protein T05_4029, partial [Trichinella murrelli]
MKFKANQMSSGMPLKSTLGVDSKSITTNVDRANDFIPAENEEEERGRVRYQLFTCIRSSWQVARKAFRYIIIYILIVCRLIVPMPSGKCETERKGNAPVNTGPSPNSDGRTNNTVEEADEHARGSGPIFNRLWAQHASSAPLCPKLNCKRSFFEIEAFLEARDCLDVVGGETVCPPKDESEIKAWKKRDALARSIILRSLDDFHHAFIRSCKTSKEMLNCIVKIKEQVTVSSKLLVLSDFHAYTWKPGMNIASFIAGLNVIVNKMQSLQIELDDEIIIGK